MSLRRGERSRQKQNNNKPQTLRCAYTFVPFPTSQSISDGVCKPPARRQQEPEVQYIPLQAAQGGVDVVGVKG